MSEIKKYTKKNGETAYKFRTLLGYDEVTGKQVKPSKSGFKTKKEAQRSLAKLQLEFDNRSFSEYKNLTFKDIYLKWFDQYKMTVKESTYTKTVEHFALHILPEIGKTKISKLTTVQIQLAVNKWFKQNLSRYKRFYNYINRVLTWAYKVQIIEKNPADRIILPVNTSHIKTISENYYDLPELKHFFKCLHDMDNDTAEIYFRVLAFTGMLKGESLALLWTDINFETNQISINKTQSQGEHGHLLVNTPKTPTSIRTVDFDPKTMDIYTEVTSKQKKETAQKYANYVNF
ncbi:site-specific integrase [Companilactobacillus crustorum]|nr:site-specific integrase [Companilactobacillus crustorum]APU71692.1 hypothetical protein BI355_1374 [Companilactobacillus crustorum]WDT66290.1 site-specific integrase [Companilactobacillus crustorum]HCD07426.1 site-specific integrase [Lactobacillus sp.]